ncbi:MAG: molybdenum ABC transporter ATP-binding protein [Hyphomicrobiaceae bacterium]
MIEVKFETQLAGTSFDVAFSAPGEGVTALFGRSGAGKSVIMETLAGGHQPATGHVRVNDDTFIDTDKGHLLPVHQRRIGYVFQDSRLFPHLSVKSNLLYGFKRAKGRRFVEIDHAVALLGLEDLMQRRPHRLSGGERQRVAIGRAILSQPAILLMDEPLSSLDPPRKAELLPYIERLRDDLRIPIVYISHDFNEVMRLADYLVVVDHGRVAKHGPLLELASDPDLSPLIGRFEAGAVIACKIEAHDRANDLTRLVFAGHRLTVPFVDSDIGTEVRVRLRARDVAVALSEPQDTSIANRLQGTLVELIARDGPFVDAGIDVGGTIIRALLTRASAQRLQLSPGQSLWVLIRVVAMDSRSVGFMRRPRQSGDGVASP